MFVKPLAAEFDAPRLVVVLGLTLLMLMQGIVSPFLGRALDRYSIRGIMVLGLILCAGGLFGLSVATSLWQIGLLFGSLIAVGSHMFGPLATSTLIAHWFVRDRGQALGVTALGASAGGLIFPFAATRLMEEMGWRGAVSTFAVVLLVFAGPLWALVVNRPEQLGERPDGLPSSDTGAAPEEPAPSGEVQSEMETDLLRSSNFWVITSAIGLAFCSASALIAHLVPYVSDRGYDPRAAALVMSAYAGAGAVGRLLAGWLADRVDQRIASWGVFGVMAGSWLGLVLAPSYAGLVAASIGLGLGVGGVMPLWGALTGACFGRAVFGRAMGLMTPLMLPFNLAGAPIAAYAFDRTGSYTLVLSAFLATFVLGAIVISFLRVPAVEPGT